MRTFGSVAIAVSLAATGGAVAAQTAPPSVSVGRIDTEQRCTLLPVVEGKGAAVRALFFAAAIGSFKTSWQRDCVDNFRTTRTSLEAALAGARTLTVRPTGGAYVVTLRLSDVSGDNQAPARAPQTEPEGYAYALSQMRIGVDLKLTGPGGRIVYGDVFTKSLETSYDVRADGFRAWGSKSGQQLYAELQHEVALDAARKVAFHLQPLQVLGSDGRDITLNYGAPLLRLGAIVIATAPDGATGRYRVISATATTATAEAEGGEPGRIQAGALATFVEADSPEANARRYRRVDLP